MLLPPSDATVAVRHSDVRPSVRSVSQRFTTITTRPITMPAVYALSTWGLESECTQPLNAWIDVIAKTYTITEFVNWSSARFSSCAVNNRPT